MLYLTNIGLLATYNSKTSAFERIYNCTVSIDDEVIIDINGDGTYNVLDVVLLVNDILNP